MATFEIQAPNGKKYRVEGETQEGALAALKKMLGQSQGSLDMTAKSEAAIEQAKLAGGSPGLASFAQGALMNFGDELIGAVEAAKSGFEPGAYTQARDRAREFTGAAEAEAGVLPGILGQITTGVLGGGAAGVSKMLGMLGLGAAEGGAAAYGATEQNDAGALQQTALGAGLGAAGAGLGMGIGKMLEKFTSRGLAFNTIRQAMDGKVDELVSRIRQLGGSAAEADEVLREVLRGQASKNPTAAAAAVPGAQARLAGVNAEVKQAISDIISPENAKLFIDRLKKEAQQFSEGAYGKAYATEGRVGLVPELANNPGLEPAIDAARRLAEMEGRTFDVTALGVKDLDAMQRALRGEADKLFKEGGTETIFGPVKSGFRQDVNDLAKAMSQDFADVQARYAQNVAQREAVDLGRQALNPQKEAVEVAEEFAALSAPQKEAYRAAVATRARALLSAKVPTANAAQALRPEAIIDKLKAVGFPEEQLNALIEKGGAARGVLDALQGGSDTARKMAAAKASESPLTKVKAGDLAAAALVHPATLGILPALREAGTAQERVTAEMLIRALTSQDPRLLSAILNRAPQRATPLLGILGAAGGASQTGQLQ
jgi:hypothetical protein